jgi:hypothetical protein
MSIKCLSWLWIWYKEYIMEHISDDERSSVFIYAYTRWQNYFTAPVLVWSCERLQWRWVRSDAIQFGK